MADSDKITDLSNTVVQKDVPNLQLIHPRLRNVEMQRARFNILQFSFDLSC